MPGSSPTDGRMGAEPGSHALRYRLAQVLERYTESHPQREIAERLGIACSSVCRHGSDLSLWRADQLLALACADDDLRHAVRALLYGEHPHQSMERAAMAAVRGCGEYMEQAVAALEDGRVDAQEARRLLPLLSEQRQRFEDLLAVAQEIAGRGGRRG